MPDVLVMVGKRKQGYEYLSIRQEIAETKLREQKLENAVLQRSLEEHKRSVEEFTERLRTTNVSLEEQKSNVQQPTDEVSNRNSRVLRLEADNLFMAGDLHEKCIVEEDLRQKCMQLQLKVDKLTKLEKELSATKDAKKRNDKERKNKSETKVRVLRAFEWEENTANPMLLRAVTDFWYALSVATEGDQSDTKQRLTQKDVMMIWKEVTLNGWDGKMRIELQKEFIRSKKYCPIQMARSSDVNCTFNVRAASDIAKCDLTRKNTSEACYQAIKRVGVLCNVFIMQRYKSGFRRFLFTKTGVSGVGVMRTGVSQTE